MAIEPDATRTCPYCKEVVKQDATRCKHCHSNLTPERLEHGGICPYCKEDINPEAVRCKHCLADLANEPDSSGAPSVSRCRCKGEGHSGGRGGAGYGVVYFDDSPHRPSPTGSRCRCKGEGHSGEW